MCNDFINTVEQRHWYRLNSTLFYICVPQISPWWVSTKILLTQIDGKMPNLALMKISSYYKAQGHEAGFNVTNPDKVFISCIFSKNMSAARGAAKFYPKAEIQIGGPALMAPNELPKEVEHRMPDYSLYSDMDYSLGFTTRGCIRSCPFCIVHLIEGPFREHAHPSEFHHPDHEKIVFFDNNFTASTNFAETLSYLRDHGLRGCFNQGLDARLITEEKATQLVEAKLWNLHFTRPTWYFSWDLIEEEDDILRGLNRMMDAGASKHNLKVYVLVGFNTTHDQDYYRVKKLIDMGIEPFVMKYNGMRRDKWLNSLTRWVNRRFYKSCDFQDYKPLVNLNSGWRPQQ